MSIATSNISNHSVKSKNVFVTQINERDDEADDGVTKHLIVKESPSSLLKTGLNTFQSTLVVKKEHEINNVDNELYIKRQEYEMKMIICSKKKQQLLLRQQSLLDQMKSFDSFIKENDAKRRRALIKYQNEIRLIDQQKIMENDLEIEIEATKKLHKKLLEKVRYNKKFEDFLLKVVEYLPSDYIKVSENVLGGLIMRYNTLFSTNESLLTDMSNKSEENQCFTNEISKLKEDHARKLLQNNYRLSKMYEKYERLKEQFERGEQQFKLKHGDIRTEILNFGVILRAIDNITKKCERRFDDSISEDEIENKLDKIKNYIITSQQIIEIVSQTKDKSNNHLPPISQKTNASIPNKYSKDK